MIANYQYYLSRYNEIEYYLLDDNLTEDEYQERLSEVCNKYRSDLQDVRAMKEVYNYNNFLIESMKDTYNNWYEEHALPLQKEILEANLKQGERYTLVYINEFGFPVCINITLDSYYLTTYAQYNDAVLLYFKQKGKRSLDGKYFYNSDLYIYKGWHTVDKEKQQIELSENMYQSKYRAFDKQYLIDIKSELGEALVEYNR